MTSPRTKSHLEVVFPNYQHSSIFTYDTSQKTVKARENPLADVCAWFPWDVTIPDRTAAFTADLGPRCVRSRPSLTCAPPRRMKYLWTSHMCVFASFGLCSPELWELLLKLIHLYNPKTVSASPFSTLFLWLLVFLSDQFCFFSCLIKWILKFEAKNS